jgi:hypothetical protein
MSAGLTDIAVWLGANETNSSLSSVEYVPVVGWSQVVWVPLIVCCFLLLILFVWWVSGVIERWRVR